MKTPERSVEELTEWFDHCNYPPLNDNTTTDEYRLELHDKNCKWFAELIQAERQKREEVVHERDKQWKEAIQYLINNSDGTQDWFNGLRACRSIDFTQPNNPN